RYRASAAKLRNFATMMSGVTDSKKYFEFWRQVADSGWFDVEHLMETKPSYCMMSLENNDHYPTHLFLYAKMGIHNYNMIHGTNLELYCLDKYVDIPKVFYRYYYITLVTKDPAGGGSLALFQTCVVEERCDLKKLIWDIARPKPEPPEDPMQSLNIYRGRVDHSKEVRLPDEWPSENVFTDNNRYYMVKKSELLKYDWIRLYLKLAFLNANTELKNPALSKLVIVRVVVESQEKVEMPNEKLKSRNAIFYIRYKYHPNKGGVCKVHGFKPPRDRMAMVRRTTDENTGLYTLTMLDSAKA
ncbi:unnamed protein product, partial [Thlaspi arvense]